MKIITGSAKGMSLFTLEGDMTRPTSQRVKEAVFSMLQFEMENSVVLDLFAGSGQLGLEALSRGAKRAYFSDSSREAIDIIIKNAKKAKLDNKCVISWCDYKQMLSNLYEKEAFDIVFIDPPYKSKVIPDALNRLINSKTISSHTKIVCESGDADIFDLDEGLKEKFEIIKQARYSISYITILVPKIGE
ncbi:MAG: 16S rRNA (guanine(966)-N(2))-methyltransferase RsmD [Clostridia bacterium]|nr:16S rRNA (guanine(966)-N(2))-methyltransferase RsmD [Clostridia bacterium]